MKIYTGILIFLSLIPTNFSKIIIHIFNCRIFKTLLAIKTDVLWPLWPKSLIALKVYSVKYSCVSLSNFNVTLYPFTLTMDPWKDAKTDLYSKIIFTLVPDVTRWPCLSNISIAVYFGLLWMFTTIDADIWYSP